MVAHGNPSRGPSRKGTTICVFSGLKRYIYSMKLSEIYKNKGKKLCFEDYEVHVVTEDMIPEKWAKDFNRFMFGQTCMMLEDESLAYYFNDFSMWYRMNEKSILRDEAIDDTLA